VVINNFDLFRPAVTPDKTDPPLIVDPHRMLPAAVAR
jgi:hypothetical protein